jgi:hypothetical protein
MRFLAGVLVAAQLAAASPTAPSGASPALAAIRNVVEDPPVGVLPEVKTKTPSGCRQIITDETYPNATVWKAALPKAELRNVDFEGDGHTDYKIRALTYQDVIDSVKFAAKHNIRLSIINSGHDFIGRNDAPSGLLIDVSLLGGVKVLEEFVPTAQGAESPKGKINVITPKPGKQAAVTIGVGLSTQKLNNALDPSKLVTVGAAHGSVAPAGGFVSISNVKVLGLTLTGTNLGPWSNY